MRGMFGFGGGLLPMAPFVRGDVGRFVASMSSILLLALVVGYIVLKWQDHGNEEADRDVQLGFKSALYAIEVLGFQAIIFGFFLILDFIFGKIGSDALSKDAMLGGIGAIIGGGGVLFGLEVVLAKSNTSEKWLPRKFFYGVNMVISLLYGASGLIWFLASLVSWASGAAFHVPLTLALVYLPAGFGTVLLYQNLFGSVQGPSGALAGGLLALGGSHVQSWGDQAGAGMSAAASGFDQMAQNAGQQPVGMGTAPAAAAPQQAAAAPAAPQPVSGQQAVACPTCGGQGRYIAQYQRYWCDTCQKYL